MARWPRDWEAAHRVAHDVEDETAAWVHAYLHHQEGDEANAGYWYRRARRPHSRLSLEHQWEEIARDPVRVETGSRR